MAKSRICSVSECGKAHYGLGFCMVHYYRFKKHGDPLGGRLFNGAGYAWVKAHLSHRGEECLFWPYATTADGYGRTTIDGITDTYVHRFMCQSAHGAPPSGKYDAAHSCGNGHLSCVNPSHLRWATRTENVQDAFDHGTMILGEAATGNILTRSQVTEIRDLKTKVTSNSLAARFGVSRKTIQDIQARRTWKWLP